MATKKAGRAPAKKRAPRKAKGASAGLDVAACTDGTAEGAVDELAERVRAEGGAVLGTYREPIGGHPLLFAVLPIDRVEATPFQRDVSDAHEKRLADVIQKTGRFLDPIIAITAPKQGFWTPNGRHRLEAMRRLGQKAIAALIVPDRDVAWQILALNTEKAHNLKERALEVIRIYRGLLEEDTTRAESSFVLYLEDPALVTVGVCYERSPRFAGGAYHPVLRRVETFSDEPIAKAIKVHERRAELVLEVEEHVVKVVEALKARGLTSPYLRSFVVARINPLRFMKGDLPEPEALLRTMRDRAARFNIEKVRQEDLARAGGAPDEATT